MYRTALRSDTDLQRYAVVQGIFEVSLWNSPLEILAHFAEDFSTDGIHSWKVVLIWETCQEF